MFLKWILKLKTHWCWALQQFCRVSLLFDSCFPCLLLPSIFYLLSIWFVGLKESFAEASSWGFSVFHTLRGWPRRSLEQPYEGGASTILGYGWRNRGFQRLMRLRHSGRSRFEPRLPACFYPLCRIADMILLTYYLIHDVCKVRGLGDAQVWMVTHTDPNSNPASSLCQLCDPGRIIQFLWVCFPSLEVMVIILTSQRGCEVWVG